MKILVAGFGNVLRQDDGFGVELLRRLEGHPELPPGVGFLEAGIGGISLVQELLGGYDGLVILDALEGSKVGEVRVLELDVSDPSDRPPEVLRDLFADIHYAEPGRALALAKGIGSLPAETFFVGCVPRSCELGIGLSPAVREALPRATRETLDLLSRMVRTRTAAGS